MTLPAPISPADLQVLQLPGKPRLLYCCSCGYEGAKPPKGEQHKDHVLSSVLLAPVKRGKKN